MIRGSGPTDHGLHGCCGRQSKKMNLESAAMQLKTSFKPQFVAIFTCNSFVFFFFLEAHLAVDKWLRLRQTIVFLKNIIKITLFQIQRPQTTH